MAELVDAQYNESKAPGNETYKPELLRAFTIAALRGA